MKRLAWLAFLALMVVGCDGAPSTGPDLRTPGPARPGISDGGHEINGLFGNEDFFFLPPLVREPTRSTYKDRPFHPGLRPHVRICLLLSDGSACETVIKEFGPDAITVSTTDQHYRVNWDTKESALSTQRLYRLEVYVRNRLLGYGDVNPVDNGRELRNVDTNEEIGLVDGRTLPIIFRIEEGALCTFKPCTEVIVRNSEGGTFFAPDKGAAIQIPEGALPVDEIVLTIERHPMPPGALCVPSETAAGFMFLQYEGCYELTTDPDLHAVDVQPNGFRKEVVVGVCQAGVPAGFEENVELVKFDEGVGIQRLQSVAAPFLDCGGFTGTVAAANGFLDATRLQLLAMGRRVGQWIGPRPLYAGDGGLGCLIPIGDALSRFFWAMPITAEKYDGDLQQAPVGSALSLSPAVRIMTDHADHHGIKRPVRKAPVKFRVTGGGGKLVGPTGELDELSVQSALVDFGEEEIDGIATLPEGWHWRLGTAPGVNTLEVSGAFTNGVQRFEATGTADVIGSWSPAATPSATRRDHRAVLLDNGNVLIVGGTASGAELYDATTSQFGTLTTVFEHGSGASATRLLDGRVLIAGGSGRPDRAEIFDPSSGAFSAVEQALVTSRSHHTATLLADGRVLIAGGQQAVTGGPQSIDAAEVFDPAAGTFTSIASLGDDRSGHVAVRLADGRVLVAGGTQTTTPGFGIALATAEIFDPSAGTFQSTGPMTVGRAGPAAALLADGTVLVTGWSASAEIFIPETGAFLATEGAPAEDHTAGTMTVLADGRVLLAGGVKSGPVTHASAEVYDPSNGAFSAAASMIAARQQHTATLLPDGRVLVVGGYSFAANSDLRSAEIFSLGSPPVIY